MAKSFAVVCLLGLLAGVSAQSCKQGSLTKHNELRKLHGAGDLIWDNKLAKQAQTSANALAANKCALKGGSGGNVWACYGKNCGTCAVAVDEWYKGGSAYRFDVSKPYTDNKARFMEWGAFTQIVWNGAKKMACAIARGENCAVVNCFYDIGNVQGDKWYSENVLPKGTKLTSGPSDGQIGDAWSAEELPECADWAASKYCEENGPEYLFTENGVTKTVTEWCPISCPTKRSPKKASTKTSGPSDKQCEAWAKQGSCVPSGPLFFYKDPKTKEVRDIASWCPKACPYTPPGYVPTNVVVARKMMSKLFLKASEDHAETASA